jgi:hypothetical protein
MRAEDAGSVFVLVDIKHQLLLHLFVYLRLLLLDPTIPPSVLDAAVGDHLDRGDPVLPEVVAQFEVADEVVIGCADDVHFAVVADEVIGQSELTLKGGARRVEGVGGLHRGNTSI